MRRWYLSLDKADRGLVKVSIVMLIALLFVLVFWLYLTLLLP